jgi:hypothetical protein
MKLRLLSLAGVLLATMVGGSTAMAGQAKHYICHRTASESNPYVLIHVATPAKVQAHLSGDLKGHFDTRVGGDYLPTQYEIANGCGATPPEPRLDSRLNTRVCGDPRLLITINNRRSNVPVTYRVRIRHANGGYRTFTKTVPAGQRDVLMPRWVKGRSYVSYSYSAPGVYTPAVVRSFRLPRSTPWGKGSCPQSLRHAQQLARRY